MSAATTARATAGPAASVSARRRIAEKDSVRALVIFMGRRESLMAKLRAYLRSFINHDNGDGHVSQRRGAAASSRFCTSQGIRVRRAFSIS